MSDLQLYFAVGVPLLFNGVALTIGYMLLNTRISALETRMNNLEQKFDIRFDLLMGKLVELDNRLTRLEEKGAK